MNDLPIIALTELVGNSPPHLTALQAFLLPFLSYLVSFWWFVWILTLFALVRYVIVHGDRTAVPSTDNEPIDD